MVKIVLKSLSLKNKQGKIKTKMICKKRPNPLCMFDSYYQEHTEILENNRESFWMILIEIRKGFRYVILVRKSTHKGPCSIHSWPSMAFFFMYLAFSLDVVQGLVTKWNTILLNIKKTVKFIANISLSYKFVSNVHK